jgi:hypothetical protein
VLTVLTASPLPFLASLARLKRDLGISSADTALDDYHRDLIREASDAIKRHCKRRFCLQTYRETVAGNGSNFLSLEEFPIVEIVAISREGVEIDITDINLHLGADDYSIDDAEYGVLDSASGWTPRLRSTGGVSPAGIGLSGQRNWSLDYRAGWYCPGELEDDGARNLPGDIERACIETVKHWRRINEVGSNVKSQSIGDLSITYGANSERAFPDYVKEMLADYVRNY